MSHVPHNVYEEFPDRAQQIGARKLIDPRFRKLLDSYHALNRAIHRAETNVEPTDDFHMLEMRKERLHLKDEIAGQLAMV
ncbi:hypothetical protein So717_06880 [Roseobacter cerasinus]|uniref:DUF465 domain-containing protein n=1 Tax=Roseobacter cerasinus TaxID=2602289 RepID=A0A640VPZ1_9RHOB|nr:YdcH family protein [Roseobacter cerasinus]GFE48935.1 hypothetical protein So717_06880 [Roseobacter cerasinus]